MNGHAGNCLDTREAAARPGIPPTTLARCRVRGEGSAFRRFGARVRYRLADLEVWASARRRTSTWDDGVAAGTMTR